MIDIKYIKWRRAGLNEMQYQLHGALMALEVVRRSGCSLAEAKAKTILDFGCGTGRVSRALTLYFKHVTGFDPSPQAIQLARTECPPWKMWQGKNLAYCQQLPTSQFDVVCAVDVVGQIADDHALEVFGQIKNCVAPGGCAIVWLSSTTNPTLCQSLSLSIKDKATHVVVWRL